MFQCDGEHEHDIIEGRGETDRARLWPWSFAVAIANGIMDYLSEQACEEVRQKVEGQSAFPGAAAADPGGWEPHYGPDGSWAPAAAAAPSAAAPAAAAAEPRRRIPMGTKEAASSNPTKFAPAAAVRPAQSSRGGAVVETQWKCRACSGAHVRDEVCIRKT